MSRLLLILILLIPFTVNGQFNLNGTVRDSITLKNLPYATISLYNSIDSTLITYRLSNSDGGFEFKNLPVKLSLRLIISHIGYEPYRQELLLKEPITNLTIDALLRETSLELDAVLVNSERPPVVIRKDTIEFNVSSFKTLPNALLEDLLKKLPGVEIESNGSIKVNGKSVNKIMVDGRDFFSGDIKIATRNLPANMIEKVQVTDEKDELGNALSEFHTENRKIINLKLKKGFKKGWMGKAYSGAGSNNRFEVGGLLNTFRDTLQISLLGYSNNINKPSFGLGDLQDMGGFKRSGMSGIKSMQSGLSLNGLSLGGSDNGIQKSTGSGVNINNEINKKISLNFQYFYGHINNKLNEELRSEQFFGDTLFKTLTQSSEIFKDNSHLLTATIKWKLNSKTILSYTPSLFLKNTQINNLQILSSKVTFDSIENDGINHKLLNDRYNSANQNLTILKAFKKPGRILTASFKTYLTNETKNDIYAIDANIGNGPDKGVKLNQLKNQEIGSTRISTFISYKEPISKNYFIKLSNNYERIITNSNIEALLRRNGFNEYDSLYADFSGMLKRTGYKNTTSVLVSGTLKNLQIQIGNDIYFLNYKDIIPTSSGTSKKYTYQLPRLSIAFNDISIEYVSNVSEPQISYLQPVPDNSSPFYLRYGNLELNPEITHSLYIDYNKYNFKKGENWNIYIDGGISKNAIIFMQDIDEKSVIHTYPINSKNNWHIGGTFSWGRRLKLSKNNSLGLRSSLNPNFRKNEIVLANKISESFDFSMRPTFSASLNFNDRVEINNKYSYAFSINKYTYPGIDDLKYYLHNLQSEIIVRIPRHFVFETLIDYYSNSLWNVNEKRNILKWNASFSYLFFKNESAQLKFSIIDILNQNSNIKRMVSVNQFSESIVTTLPRYCMLSMVYNIRNLRQNKVGGKNSLLFF
ncbi:MAG: hypothetical protein B6D37_12880 [Sphingobacteriales bacterium UTBCD1]|nr:MAG: hypothetical protein B6D37_12880 [Sphingobacteriales bacterium UTBCD1]